MRGRVCRHCGRKDGEVSYNTYFKMNNLQIQYGTEEVGFTSLYRFAFVTPDLAAVQRQTVKYRSAKPLFNG